MIIMHLFLIRRKHSWATRRSAAADAAHSMAKLDCLRAFTNSLPGMPFGEELSW